MRDRGTVLAAILAAGMLACGGADEASTAEGVEETVARSVAAATGGKASSDTTPCELLNDGLMRAHFELGPEVEIARTPSKRSPHPFCTVRWAKPDAEEIRKRTASAMSDYMQRKIKGEDVAMPSFRTENEVSLTLYEPVFESADYAMRSFDSAMKLLSDGMTATRGDVEVTFQADVTPVEGVGRKAMWAPTMRQLSVVTDDRILHLTVNTGADHDAERAKATAIARQLVREL